MKNNHGETPYKLSLRGKIIRKATKMFHTHGIKSVKMDDIANALSISKRTIYEVFETKELLLEEVVNYHDEEAKTALSRVAEEGDVMDVLIAFYSAAVRNMTEVSPLFFEELHKYPKIIEMIRTSHQQRREAADRFFLRGVEEGYFRSDVNIAILHRFSDAISSHVMSTFMYREYPMTEIHRNMLLLMMRGMCTEKGVQRLDAFLRDSFS